MGVSCGRDGAAISELLEIAGVGGAADDGGGGAAQIGACLESTDGANRREHVLHATRSRSSAISQLPVSVRAFKEPSIRTRTFTTHNTPTTRAFTRALGLQMAVTHTKDKSRGGGPRPFQL